jgi:hypothetical protein
MVLTADRLGLAAGVLGGQVSPGRLQAVRAAILVWLWARPPCPTHFRAPSVLSIRPRPALATYQGADPALASGSPFDGSSEPPAYDDVADAVVVQGILHALLAVATDRGDGARFSFRCVLITRLIAGQYVRGAE